MLKTAGQLLQKSLVPSLPSMLSKRLGATQHMAPCTASISLCRAPRHMHSLCHQQFAAGCCSTSPLSDHLGWSVSGVSFSSRSRRSQHQHWLPPPIWPMRSVHPWPSKQDDQDSMKRWVSQHLQCHTGAGTCKLAIRSSAIAKTKISALQTCKGSGFG